MGIQIKFLNLYIIKAIRNNSMKFSIKSLLSLFLIYGTVAIAADTASILPPAKTTFFDQNGNPLTGGKVDFYIPGTTNRKTTWQDAAETIPNTNPVVLDAAGRAIILGSGSYRQVVKDKNNNLIWDQVTSSPGSSGGGATTVGDGNNVGAIIPWPGLIAPSGYVFTYGQEIDRVTFASLLTAITQSQNVTCVSGNATLNTVADTTQLNVGAAVEGSCIAANSVIVSKTSNTVTLNNNATASTTTTAIFFPWGNGNAITTFNVPDLRGVVLPGRNNMGGSSSSNLTTSFYTDPNALGGSGGTQSKTLLSTNLPAYIPSGTITNGAITNVVSGGTLGAIANTTAVSAAGHAFADVGSAIVVASSQATSTFTGAASPGASIPFSIVQPSKTINYIIKIQPNISISIARCGDLLDAGTACTANTGTSGHTLPFLDGNNTFSGSNIFNSGITINSLAAALVGRSSASGGPDIDFTIQGLTLKGTPDASLDFILLYDHVAGDFKKVTPGQIASSATAGVSSLGGLTGALSLGSGLTTSGGNTVLTFYQQLGTGTLATDLIKPIQLLGVTPQDYGAKCDNSTDDVAALTAWMTDISNGSGIGGRLGVLSGEICIFKSQISILGRNDWSIRGAGPYTSTLRYAGAATNIDLIVIGDGIGPTSRVTFEDFRIDSSTVMTSGSAIHIKKSNYYTFNNIVLQGAQANNLWNGIFWDEFNFGRFVNSNIAAQNDPHIFINGGPIYMDGYQCLNSGGQTCLHFAGNSGGLYLGEADIFGATFGLKIDTSLSAGGNSQFFVSSLAIFDSNVVAAVYIDDNVISGKSFMFNGWASSTATGNAFDIVNFKNGNIQIGGGSQFLSNNQNAFYYADGSVTLTIDASVALSANGGYGVFCTLATNNIFSDAKHVLPNTSGDYHPNCHVEQLGSTGYRKSANGYIHQWGAIAGNGASDTAVTLPLVCPNSMLSVTGNITSANSASNILESLSFSALTTTGFTGYARAVVGGGGTVVRSAEPWNWDAWCR